MTGFVHGELRPDDCIAGTTQPCLLVLLASIRIRVLFSPPTHPSFSSEINQTLLLEERGHESIETNRVHTRHTRLIFVGAGNEWESLSKNGLDKMTESDMHQHKYSEMHGETDRHAHVCMHARLRAHTHVYICQRNQAYTCECSC